MTPLLTLWMWSVSPALAQDCDGRALARQLRDTPPIQLAEAFVTLARCDPSAARRSAKATVPRLLRGDQTGVALLEAAHLGAGDEARAWLTQAEPDVRSRTIDTLGGQCDEHPGKVTSFFVDSASSLGDAFWEQRWYRGLGDCRTDALQALLRQGLDHPKVGRDAYPRTPFYGLLDVYARNLGVEALPTLSELLANPRDDREAVSLVDTFAEAARVGDTNQPSQTRATVIAALLEAVPSLPREAVERARGVLNALEDPESASRIARHAWPNAWSEEGYTWAIAVTETVTCRNGKVDVYLYLGEAVDPQGRWPDDLTPRLQEAAESAWEIDGASRCKGTSTLELETPGVPQTAEARAEFLKERARAFEDSPPDARKTRVFDDQRLTLN